MFKAIIAQILLALSQAHSATSAGALPPCPPPPAPPIVCKIGGPCPVCTKPK